MKKVTAFIRPHRLEELKAELMEIGVSGLTVNDVRGSGNSTQPEPAQPTPARIISLPIQSKLTMIVADALVEPVIETIVRCLRTGKSGDGKIFVEPIEQAIRIRTSERGDAAL